jgi:hypothetical protein
VSEDERAGWYCFLYALGVCLTLGVLWQSFHGTALAIRALVWPFYWAFRIGTALAA